VPAAAARRMAMTMNRMFAETPTWAAAMSAKIASVEIWANCPERNREVHLIGEAVDAVPSQSRQHDAGQEQRQGGQEVR
jgi:hypothetical protein